MRRRVHFREDVDDDGELVELHPLLQWDMAAVIWLVQQKEERQWLRKLVHSTTSRRRTQDISLLIWFVFIIMIPEFGFPYFWICVGNLLAVATLQYLAERPRPIDLYYPLVQLQDRRCIDEDTRGFPCVDCHMAVVVLLPAILHTQSVIVQLIFIAIILYIALCKLLLATRFISQVLGSWLMGFTGILIGNHGQYCSNCCADCIRHDRAWNVDREQRQQLDGHPEARLYRSLREYPQLGRSERSSSSSSAPTTWQIEYDTCASTRRKRGSSRQKRFVLFPRTGNASKGEGGFVKKQSTK
ncbi:hypothetical protein V7S43_005345 [Phytophthora oleae]|uniref:Uncharacterized protein n=1 Tax=Phytophthora oleae TaxID=2107226 RepID=A0ABD3FTB7_9STRA